MVSADGTRSRNSLARQGRNGPNSSRNGAFKDFIAKDKIAEFIRTRILEGRYKAGHYLSETMLQGHLREANLDFSRVPIREALGALEVEKLVEIVPNRGTFICDMGRETIEEILQARLIIEQHVARQLALHPHTDLREAEQ